MTSNSPNPYKDGYKVFDLHALQVGTGRRAKTLTIMPEWAMPLGLVSSRFTKA